MYMEPEFDIFEQSKPLWRKKNHEKALEINTVHSGKLQPPNSLFETKYTPV